MQFEDFLKRCDRDLPNEVIIENLVTGQFSLGPLKPGLPLNEVKALPLTWQDDAADGSRIQFVSDCTDHIRMQDLNVQRDEEGIVRYIQWILNYNPPPREPSFISPEAMLAQAFEKTLGKPKRSNKAGKKWASGEISLMLSEGNGGGESFAGFVVIGVLHEPFRSRSVLDSKLSKL